MKVRNSLKKSDQYYAEFFIGEIRKIFLLEIDPNSIKELLKIAIISVARDYYFQKVKSDTIDLLREGSSKEYAEKIFRDRFGRELSRHDINLAVEYGAHDWRHKERW